MEHMMLHDWCSSGPEAYIAMQKDLENSVTDRILRNTFHDPLMSSESEDEEPIEKIDWSEIFKTRSKNTVSQGIVPGFYPVPPFPKLSSLSIQQHYQLLKVLCAQNPEILPEEFISRPKNQDFKAFTELSETYMKEQEEFKEWAKTMWTTDHCVRALRPKLPVEMVYDAEFKLAAHRLESFPKNYAVAAQIPLVTSNANCKLVRGKSLIKVRSPLPKVDIPDLSDQVYIMAPCPMPEPCSQHPCRFTLPNETSTTTLPLTEVQRELAQYAADHGAQYVASEEALRCLMELDRHWFLAVSVCSVISQDCQPMNAVVFDSEFSLRREPAPTRTRKAFRGLLEHALRRTDTNTCEQPNKYDGNGHCDADALSESSDEDENHLYIDTDDIENTNGHIGMKTTRFSKRKKLAAQKTETESKDFFHCKCRDIDKPPQRSFKKWNVINKETNENYSIIIHVPHRTMGELGEVILEPQPEYQLELCASEPPLHLRRGQALALMLRTDAQIVNVRIDSSTGEIVTVDRADEEQFAKRHGDVAGDVRGRLFAVLAQLQGLVPGHYLLRHELSHGDNAILYRAVRAGPASQLGLQFDAAQPLDPDESRSVKSPPAVSAALLPIHKYRKVLPCAFSPFASHLARAARAPRRPPARARTPPRALQWPKGKRKKNNNNRRTTRNNN